MQRNRLPAASMAPAQPTAAAACRRQQHEWIFAAELLLIDHTIALADPCCSASNNGSHHSRVAQMLLASSPLLFAACAMLCQARPYEGCYGVLVRGVMAVWRPMIQGGSSPGLVGLRLGLPPAQVLTADEHSALWPGTDAQLATACRAAVATESRYLLPMRVRRAVDRGHAPGNLPAQLRQHHLRSRQRPAHMDLLHVSAPAVDVQRTYR